MPRKNLRKKAPRRRKGVKRRNRHKRNKMSTTVVRHGSCIADRTFVKLKYTEQTQDQLATNGAGYGYIAWRFNAPQDVSSTLSTYQPVGYGSYATLYERQWTRASKCEFEFSNMEDFPIMVVVWPSAPTFTVSPSASYIQSMISNTYSRHCLLSAKGGLDRGKISMYISTKKLVGDKNASVDSVYSSPVNAVPSRLCYWNIGVYPVSVLDVFTTALPVFEFRMTHYIEFYDRREIVSQITDIDYDDNGQPVGP